MMWQGHVRDVTELSLCVPRLLDTPHDPPCKEIGKVNAIVMK